MGWSIRIKTDKPVTDEVVRECVKGLPVAFQGPWGSVENEWGWSCAVDVQKPSQCPKTLGWYISGAWFSAGCADGFAEFFKLMLEQRGYKVTLGEFSG